MNESPVISDGLRSFKRLLQSFIFWGKSWEVKIKGKSECFIHEQKGSWKQCEAKRNSFRLFWKRVWNIILEHFTNASVLGYTMSFPAVHMGFSLFFFKKCCCFLLLFYLFVCLLIPVSVTACSTGHVEACPLLLKQWKCFTACRHVNSIITYTIISYSCCYCKCVCTVLSTQIIAYTRRGPTRDWPDTINFL